MGERKTKDIDRDLLQELRRLSIQLLPLGLRTLVVFGSRVRGDYLRDSDVDVLIVADTFRGLSFYEREYIVSKKWLYSIPLEAWCYTPEEVEKNLFERPRIDIVDAIENGLVVYDDGFWSRLRLAYSKKPYRWRKTSRGFSTLVLERD